MDEDHQTYAWRERALHLSWKLTRAHNLVDDLASALDEGDETSALLKEQVACNAVKSVARAVKSMRSDLPPDSLLAEPEALGSTLAIGGSGIATMALDVKVKAMMALASTHDDGDTDFLIGACVDAESAYGVAAAVVEAAPRRHGPAVLDLRRAFGTEGGIALRSKLIKARPRVRDIYERTRSAA